MSELNEDIAQRLKEALEKGISEDSMKSILKKVEDIRCEIEGDLQYRVRDELASNLVAFVCDMAERTVKAILDGNEREMQRYLGCERGKWTGRSDSPHSSRALGEWHPVIHGHLFEQGAVKLRHEIVAAHPDLIANERIKDLEDQVASLVLQVNKANSEKDKMWERFREHA